MNREQAALPGRPATDCRHIMELRSAQDAAMHEPLAGGWERVGDRLDSRKLADGESICTEKAPSPNPVRASGQFDQSNAATICFLPFC